MVEKPEVMQPGVKRIRIGTSKEPREAVREPMESSLPRSEGARLSKCDKKAEQKKLAAKGRVINGKHDMGDLRKAANSDILQEEEKNWGPLYSRKFAEEAERL